MQIQKYKTKEHDKMPNAVLSRKTEWPARILDYIKFVEDKYL